VSLPVKKEKPKKDTKDTKEADKEKSQSPLQEIFPSEAISSAWISLCAYRRCAARHQYWSPEDPQKTPYDDTGWTFGELFGVQVVRVTDLKVLDVAMERVVNVHAPGALKAAAQSSRSTTMPSLPSPPFVTR